MYIKGMYTKCVHVKCMYMVSDLVPTPGAVSVSKEYIYIYTHIHMYTHIYYITNNHDICYNVVIVCLWLVSLQLYFVNLRACLF